MDQIDDMNQSLNDIVEMIYDLLRVHLVNTD